MTWADVVEGTAKRAEDNAKTNEAAASADEARNRRTQEPNYRSRNEQSETGEEDMSRYAPPLPQWGITEHLNDPDEEGNSSKSEDDKFDARKIKQEEYNNDSERQRAPPNIEEASTTFDRPHDRGRGMNTTSKEFLGKPRFSGR